MLTRAGVRRGRASNGHLVVPEPGVRSAGGQNMPLSWAAASGITWSTSQCSTTFVGEHPPELDSLAPVLRSHPPAVVDGRLLPVANVGVVLYVPVTRVSLDRIVDSSQRSSVS